MNLDNQHQQEFKEWLVNICSSEDDEVNSFFTGGGIVAHYDSPQQLFIMHPSKRVYSREQVEHTFYHENKFELLVAEMLK